MISFNNEKLQHSSVRISNNILSTFQKQRTCQHSDMLWCIFIIYLGNFVHSLELKSSEIVGCPFNYVYEVTIKIIDTCVIR